MLTSCRREMRAKRTTILLAGCLTLLAGIALAEEDHLQARRLVEEGAIRPLADILDQVRLQQPGHILEVELEREEGRYIYEIELLDDTGVVWKLDVDAQNGELLKSEQEE